MEMVHKNKKLRAIELRKKGRSYSEILKEVSVAKSTLSLWLRSVGLSKIQKQKLTEKKRVAALRGGQARHRARLEKRVEIITHAEKEISKLSLRDTQLLGTVLYWAEGSKEKLYRGSTGLSFINSDPHMIKCYLLWLKSALAISPERITFEIYIHENSRNNRAQMIEYWSSCTGFPSSALQKVYYKKGSGKTNRYNTGREYYGLLRVRVKASSDLVRKVAGWTEGIIKQWAR